MTQLNGKIPAYLNDRELGALGADFGCTIRCEAMSGVGGGVADDLTSVAAPGRYGTIVTADRPKSGAGSCGFTLRVESTSLAALCTAMDQVKAFITQGQVRIRTGYREAREAMGRGTVITTVYDYPGNVCGRLDVTYTLDDPLWYDLVPQSLTMSKSSSGVGARTATPLGTGTAAPFVRIFGPSGTTVLLVYRSSQGTVIGTQTLAAVSGNLLAATDYLDVDTSLKTIVKTASGVAGTKPAGLSLVVAPSYWPLLDPEDGDRYGNAWPTLELVDSANTATAWVTYTRSWR